MESIDTFRKTAEDCTVFSGSIKTVWMTESLFTQMLDAIEREVEEGCVELPKDANGETIHLGDMIERCGRVFKVAGLSETQVFCFDDDGEILNYGVKVIHRHKPPTVEDMLREMLGSYDVKRGYTCGHQTPQNEIIAEYAKCLQLREEEE